MIRIAGSITKNSVGLLRFYSKSLQQGRGFINDDLNAFDDSSTGSSTLPFDNIRHSETFGQLVRSEHIQDSENYEHVIKPDTQTMSPFRNADGSFIKGNNSEEARLDDLTLLARVDRSVCKLPTEIAKAINNNILRLAVPDKLRERAATVYQSLEKEQIQKAPDNGINSDAHIAALFVQNYSHAHQVLLELRKRVGEDKFNPQHILDIGYGPATGIVALNEIMGPEWVPIEKEAYIIGRRNNHMKKRAKIILSRQLNENIQQQSDENEVSSAHVDSKVVSSQPITQNTTTVDPESDFTKNEMNTSESSIAERNEVNQENATQNEESDEDYNDEYVGPINTAAIKIRTKLRDNLPVTKKYDLIMVNQSLLTREYNFPKDIDINLHNVLRLLKPEGHIVIIERGNTLGFETIARARQLMLRPESHVNEEGKIPRPYIRGSTIKPQRELRKNDQILTEIDRFESEIIEKYGDPTVEDLRFEFEDDENFELLSLEEGLQQGLENGVSSESVDYHLKVIAPCSHHKVCPLQLGDPKYYKISSHKHRLNFCAFTKTVERPKFSMELKRGKRLATTWDKSAVDGMGLDKMSRKSLQALEGSGRPGGKNTEQGSYSYLIAQRSKNDDSTIKSIDQARETNQYFETDERNNWPRIIQTPTKVKNNVKLNVCSPTGNIETWTVPKSLGKQVYHDARKVELGDLWPLAKKSVVVKNKLSEESKIKLQTLAKTQKKSFIKEQRNKLLKKKTTNFQPEDIGSIADEIAQEIENSKKYKQKGKKMKFDVDLSKYDGK